MKRAHSLRLGLLSIYKKDSSAFRKLMFSELCRRSFLASFANEAYKRNYARPLVTALLIIYSLRRVLTFQIKNADTLGIASYENERRNIQQFLKTFSGSPHISNYQWRVSSLAENVPYLVRFLCSGKMQLFEVLKALSRKNDFLVFARQTEFVVLYSYFTFLSRQKIFSPTVMVISSESNPEVIAPALALNDQTVSIYVNHGYLNKDQGHFFHDHFVLSFPSLAARMKGDLHFLKSHSVSVKRIYELKKILIVTSIVLDESKVIHLASSLAETFPAAEIIIRLHPNKMLTGNREPELKSLSNVTISAGSYPIEQDLNDSDLVIGGETTALLDALLAGIPVLHWKLDEIQYDHYGLVFEGIIPAMPNTNDVIRVANDHYHSEIWAKKANNFFSIPADNKDLKSEIEKKVLKKRAKITP